LQDVLDTETDNLRIFDSRNRGVFDVRIGCPGVDTTEHGKNGNGQRLRSSQRLPAQLGKRL